MCSTIEKNKTISLLISIMLLSNATIYSQATLLQTFTEDSLSTFGFGGTVCSIGDVNNDGVKDILIGAYKKKEAFVYTVYNATSVNEGELNNLDFELFQNYPNPFNPSTTIAFNIVTRGDYKLTIYNLLGQKVKTLVNGELMSGFQKVTLNANTLTSGIYFYSLSGENVEITKKMLLIK